MKGTAPIAVPFAVTGVVQPVRGPWWSLGSARRRPAPRLVGSRDVSGQHATATRTVGYGCVRGSVVGRSRRFGPERWFRRGGNGEAGSRGGGGGTERTSGPAPQPGRPRSPFAALRGVPSGSAHISSRNCRSGARPSCRHGTTVQRRAPPVSATPPPTSHPTLPQPPRRRTSTTPFGLGEGFRACFQGVQPFLLNGSSGLLQASGCNRAVVSADDLSADAPFSTSRAVPPPRGAR